MISKDVNSILPQITTEDWFNWLELLVQRENNLLEKKLAVRMITNFETFKVNRARIHVRVRRLFNKLQKILKKAKKFSNPYKRLKSLSTWWEKTVDSLYYKYAFDMSLRRNDPQKIWHPELKPVNNITDVYETRFEKIIADVVKTKQRKGEIVKSQLQEFKNTYIIELCYSRSTKKIKKIKNDIKSNLDIKKYSKFEETLLALKCITRFNKQDEKEHKSLSEFKIFVDFARILLKDLKLIKENNGEKFTLKHFIPSVITKEIRHINY